jgi:hypothetical protein
MNIVFDENFSPYLVKGLASFEKGRAGDGVQVCHIIDLVGRGKPDESWIPEMARIGATVVTQDSNIRRTPHLRQMCADYKLGMIFFMSPRRSPYTYWLWIEAVVRCWSEIRKRSRNTELPFAFEIRPHSRILLPAKS